MIAVVRTLSISNGVLKQLILCWVVAMVSITAIASESDWQQFAQPVFHSPLSNSTPLEGQIGTVLEDQQGFIWLLADNGAWRWDSKTLLRARFEDAPTNDEVIQVFSGFTDAADQIWLATSNGLYRLKSGSINFTPVAPELFRELTVQTGAAFDRRDNPILLLASNRELYQFNVNSQQLSLIPSPVNERIHVLHADDSDTLWVGTDQGLYYSNFKQDKFDALEVDTSFPAGVRVSVITRNTADHLVVGTAANGLFIKTPASDFQPITLSDNVPPWIFSITEVRPNVMLIGTFGDGLIELNLTTRATRHFRHNRMLPASIKDNNIWSLFRDSRGLVWIGSGSSLNVYDGSNVAVSHIFGGSGQPNSLINRKVHAVQAMDNLLIVGSGDYGLEVFSPNEGVSSRWWQSSNNPVETLFISNNGRLYASANFASVILSPENQQIAPLNIQGRSPSAFTMTLAESDRTLWVGGTDGLWQQRIHATGNANATQLLSEQLTDRRIASLLATTNSLWIGSWQGLLHGKLTNGLLDINDIKAVEHPRLAQQFIADLYVDSLGQLWVATGGAGLLVLTTDGKWLEITTKVGLQSDNVLAIAGESDGQVWAGTSHGIAAIDIQRMHLRVITDGPRAVNSPYSRAAATKTPTGDLVFGGMEGLTIITPTALSPEVAPLSLAFTWLEIITASNNNIYPILGQDDLEIDALPTRISFEFIALDYLDPDHVQYRYRILGKNESWTLLNDNQRIVTLTDPAPGDYTLELQYANDGATWQQHSLAQRFRILPAWYQTIYARMFAVVLLAIGIYLLHRLGLRQYQHRQVVLEQKIGERTAALLTANKKLREQALALEEASLTDALTGLYNRRFLSQNMQRDINRLNRYFEDCEANNIHPADESDILFFVIDMDHFKRINDNHGHQAGDAVLVETQKRLSSIFRDSDYLVRWGGEEFLAVVQGSPREEAYQLAERIIDAVNASDMTINQQTSLKVTCSVGFAAYPLQPQRYSFFDWQSTVGVADAALYGAKRRNRDTWMGITEINSNVSEAILELIKQQPSRIFEHAKVLVRP